MYRWIMNLHQSYKKFSDRNKRGFTLIEIIVSTAIVAILMSIVILICEVYSLLYTSEMSKLQDGSTIRAIQLEMEDYIKEAAYATCNFDNLKLGNIGKSENQKRLIYIEPLVSDKSPYIVIVKYLNEDEAVLQKLYVQCNRPPINSLDTWVIQGESLVPNEEFEFTSLSVGEANELSTQLQNMVEESFVEETTCVSDINNVPCIDLYPRDTQRVYKSSSADEYYAIAGDKIKRVSYMAHELRLDHGYMTHTATNIILDGIKDIKVEQQDNGSFNIRIYCGDRCIESIVAMRDYCRGERFGKK